MTLDAWCNNGIWTWTSLYILKHKHEYLNCKRTKNNHEKAVFYGNLYQAYQNTPGHCYRSSRSLRDLISDRSKLCRYVYELSDMKENGDDLTWVSKDILAKLEDLKTIMPVPKRRKRKRKAGRFRTSPRRYQQRRINVHTAFLPDNRASDGSEADNLSPLNAQGARGPPVVPAVIAPAPRLAPCAGRFMLDDYRYPPNSSSWALWLNFQLEQSVELQTTGVRPQCYNFIVKLPQGQVLAVSEDSIKALGYDLTGQQFDATRRVAANGTHGPSPEDIMAMSKSVIKQNREFGCSKMPVLYERQIRDCPDRQYIWVETYSKVLERNETEIIVCMRERNVTDAVLWGQKLSLSPRATKEPPLELIVKLENAPTQAQAAAAPQKAGHLKVPRRSDFPGYNSRSSSPDNKPEPPRMIPSSPDEPRTPPIYVGDPKVPRFMLGENNSSSAVQSKQMPTLSEWNAVSRVPLHATPPVPGAQSRGIIPNLMFLTQPGISNPDCIAKIPPFPTALPMTIKCGLDQKFSPINPAN